jgi:hypothetical protein
VDSPSRGEVLPCLIFCFLNPSACQVCFALPSLSCHILYMPCILFEEPFILSPYFLLLSRETSVDIFLGITVKVRRAAAFLSWYF